MIRGKKAKMLDDVSRVRGVCHFSNFATTDTVISIIRLQNGLIEMRDEDYRKIEPIMKKSIKLN